MKINKKKNGEKKSYIVTRETLGMTLLLFCAIIFIMLLTGSTVFAGIGAAVCTFMYGVFGYCSYFVLAALAYLGEWLVFEKRIKISFVKWLSIVLTVLCLSLLFHSVTTRNFQLESYGAYLSQCYKNAANGFSGYTFGGAISGLIVYPIAKIMNFIVCYVIFSILSLACGYLVFLSFKRDRSVPFDKESIAQPEIQETQTVSAVPAAEPVRTVEKPAPLKTVPVKSYDKSEAEKDYGRKILFKNDEFAAESYRRNMIFNESSYFNNAPSVMSSEDYLSGFSTGRKKNSVPNENYSESYQNEKLFEEQPQAPLNYVYGEKPSENLGAYCEQPIKAEPESNIYKIETPAENYSEAIHSGVDNQENVLESFNFNEPAPEPTGISEYENDTETGRVSGESPLSERKEVLRPAPATDNTSEEDTDDIFAGNGFVGRGDFGSSRSLRGERSNSELFDDDEQAETESRSIPRSVPEVSEPVERISRSRVPEKPAEKITEKKDESAPAEEKPKHVWKKYVRPGLELLKDYPENSNVNTGEIEDNKQTIVDTLQRFKIACEIANVTIGPAITRYDVIVEDKTNIKKALGFREAIAMELRKENVTAYLNYAKGAISIEIPNNDRTTVGLKGLLASPRFINAKQGTLSFALGKNVEGEVVCPDITKMPHLLVAGTTGSGKSICLSTLLVSLLYKYGPEELRLILVDPKQVEFISFDKLPHLMINEILYDVNQAIKALNWAIKEMERRYTLFKEMTESGTATKNLDEYNAHLSDQTDKLPKIVIVLDEFGDLMLQAKKDIESRIIKLAQKARACGIHLILATQRPSVDCITGLIKSNLPTRIGFKVNSFDDSRTIFDIGGAEKLLGKGDMYFRSTENPDLLRIQGCFIDSPEVQRVTDFIKANNETYFDQSVADFINKEEEPETPNIGGGSDDEVQETKVDDTFLLALRYCVNANQASVSMIQRRFPVGYIKACKIIDWMTNMNYITPSEGAKSRKVLLTKDEFIKIYGDDFED